MRPLAKLYVTNSYVRLFLYAESGDSVGATSGLPPQEFRGVCPKPACEKMAPGAGHDHPVNADVARRGAVGTRSDGMANGADVAT